MPGVFSMSKEPTTEQVEQLNSFAQQMADDQPQPYQDAHAEVTSAISNMDNPPNYTTEQIEEALELSGQGADNGPESE